MNFSCIFPLVHEFCLGVRIFGNIAGVRIRTLVYEKKNSGVETPKLSGFIPVSSLKVSQLNNNTSFSTLAETLIKQVFPV